MCPVNIFKKKMPVRHILIANKVIYDVNMRKKEWGSNKG